MFDFDCKRKSCSTKQTKQFKNKQTWNCFFKQEQKLQIVMQILHCCKINNILFMKKCKQYLILLFSVMIVNKSTSTNFYGNLKGISMNEFTLLMYSILIN